MPYAWRIGFRGRTCSGRCNWSLKRENRIVIHINVIWRVVNEWIDDLIKNEKMYANVDKETIRGARVRAAVTLTIHEVGRTSAHEVLHAYLYAEDSVRHAAPIHKQGDLHHLIILPLEREGYL